MQRGGEMISASFIWRRNDVEKHVLDSTHKYTYTYAYRYTCTR